MLKRIATELRHHIPFTTIGAVTGIIIMIIIISVGALPQIARISPTIFYILHPLHVVLSALVTTSLYRKYGSKKIWAVILVGYFEAVQSGIFQFSVLISLPHTRADGMNDVLCLQITTPRDDSAAHIGPTDPIALLLNGRPPLLFYRTCYTTT